MKKMFLVLAALLLAFNAFAKDSSDNGADIYDDGSAAAQEQKEERQKEKKVTKIKWNNKANREAAMAGDPYNAKKMIGNRTFGERLMNMNKFTKVEPFSAYLKPTLGNMFVRKGNLIYREGTDIAGFEMYYDSSAYALQFAKVDRGLVIEAINRYLDDFEEKRLDRNAKSRNTKKVYGVSDAYEDYGVISGMMTNYSRPKVFYGYVFEKKSPYFVINVQKAKNLAFGDSKSEEAVLKGDVIEQTYYLTKAQAKKLALFLSDQNIDAMQASTTVDEVSEEKDAYDDSSAKEAEPSVQKLEERE